MPLSSDPRKRARQLANLAPRPPAPPPGNRRRVTHGAFAALASDKLDEKEVQIFEALAADAPLRDADGGLPAYDGAQVRLLAEVLVRLDGVRAYLRDYGQVDPKTKQLRESVIALESRLRNEARDHLDAMGMSPRSQVRLGLDLARTVDAATALSHPDPAERERLMAEAGLIDERDEA